MRPSTVRPRVRRLVLVALGLLLMNVLPAAGGTAMTPCQRPLQPALVPAALPAQLPPWVLPLGLLAIAAADAGFYLGLYRAMRWRRHMERRLDELGDNLPAVVFQARVAARGRIELSFVAGDALQLFAVVAPVLQQRPVLLLHAALAAYRRPLLAMLRRAGATHRPLEFEFRAHGVHGVRSVLMRAWPSRADSRATHWFGYWMDDSLAQAQRAGQDAQRHRAQQEGRARDRLLQVLGQGIRAPLQQLDSAVAQLHAAPLQGQARAALDALRQATRMLQQIMADVLEEPVADVEALPLRVVPTDLHAVLRQVQQLMQPVADSRGLRLQLHTSPRLAPVLCVDALRLRQVLLNLIGNALKFTRQGGVFVRVRVLAEDPAMQQVRLQVLDSGMGIAEALQQAVFQPYAQGAPGTARHFGGTGLGLGICRRLVQRMGGRLYLHSRPHRGTRVSVELPLARPAQAAAPAAPAASAAQVLVAEDHPAHRVLLQWWLQGLGLKAVVVDDGLQALQAWSEGHFQLLVCDEQLPGLGGTALAERIRRAEQAQAQPPMAIIGMSAETAAMASPAFDGVLDKSATVDALRAVILRLRPQLLLDAAPQSSACAPACAADMPDLPTLQRRFGSAELVQQLLQLMCSSLEEDLRQLRQQLARYGAGDDGGNVAARLHRVSGALGSIGQRDMAQWLRELSMRTPPLPAQIMHEAIARLQRCQQQLQQLLAHARSAPPEGRR